MNRIQRNMKDYKVDKESFSDSFRKEVYEVISQIPVGKVSTYGGIALLLGVPPVSYTHLTLPTIA